MFKHLILKNYAITNQPMQMNGDDTCLICLVKYLNADAKVTMVTVIVVIAIAAVIMQSMLTIRYFAGDYLSN